jgi:hypothetical protein
MSAAVGNSGWAGRLLAGEGSGGSGGAVFAVDEAADPAASTTPDVTSINRDGTLLTNATAVSWTALFNVNVTGVDAGDFALAGTAATGSTITGVTAIDAATYRVTVTTGPTSGALQLNLVDDDSIVNPSNGKLLGGNGTSGAGNGSFAGQAYTIDKTAPAVGVNALPGGGTASYHQTVTITGTSSDALSAVATVVVKIVRASDGAVVAQGAATGTGGGGSYATWSFQYTPGETGAETVSALATDGAGNPKTSAARTLTILKANPVITWSDPEFGIGEFECAECDIADHGTERTDGALCT